MSVVSRFEDPSYGKLSLQTLLDLSEAFDVGLSVRFVSLVDMVRQTYVPKAADRYVESFETESTGIGFVADASGTAASVRLQDGRSDPLTVAASAFRVKPGLSQPVALPIAFSNSITIQL